MLEDQPNEGANMGVINLGGFDNRESGLQLDI